MADPTSITQYQTGFAPEIAPYATSLLGKAQAYTDTAQNPYQSYTGERVAQYSPLQQQSYDYAGQMQSAPQLQDATALAGQAGLGALNAQYTYGPSNFDAATAKSMMNPYMQNVVDVQKQQAMRDAAIAQQGQQAQAVNAGAFGGGRDAIMRNQGNAELQRGLQNIQATGLNNAYTQAQNQYNTQYGQNAAQQQFGAGLGMQGLGIANQAAQNLGALGQTQFGQNMGITGLQNQFGLQQQQQAQNLANTKYEDFQNAQNYPYKQMGFMSDMIRGLPTSQTGATMYQSAPTAIQNLTSLGLGAAGISSLMKANGGTVNSYANGGAVAFGAGGSSNQLGTMVQSDLESAYEQAVNSGDTPKIRAYKGELEYRDRVKNYKAYAPGGSVFSPEFKRYAVDHIEPRGLPLAQQNAQARGDLETNQFAMQEMADDAALRRGIAPALPPGTDVVRAAGGGILAFAGPTTANNNSSVTSGNEEENAPTITDEEIDAILAKEADGEEGSGISTAVASNPKVGEIANMLLNRKARTFSPSAQESLYRYNLQRGQRDLGPNTGAEEYNKYLTGLDSAQAGNMSRGHGMTMLRAAAALQKSGVTSGDRWGKMFENIADSEEKLQASDTAQKDYLAKAKFALADSKRKERAGLSSDSRAATSAYVKYMQEADKEGRLNAKAAGDLLVNQDRARALAARAAASGANKPKFLEDTAAMADTIQALKAKNPDDPRIPLLENQYKERQNLLAASKTSDVGPGKQEAATNTLTGSQNRKLSDHMSNFVNSTAYKKAKKVSEAEADALYDAEQTRKQTELMQGIKTSGGKKVINLDNQP